ncbi:MAG: EAL domain-containing protein, partial [Novosphingobium sp.]
MKSPLLISVLLAIIATVSGDARDVGHMYWNLWYKFDSQAVPPSYAVVSLDNGQPSSQTQVGASTERQAQLLSKLLASRPHRIFFDFPVAAGSDAQGDKALQAVIAKGGDRVVMVARGERGKPHGLQSMPKAVFQPPPGTRVAASAWYLNMFNVVLKAPPALEYGGRLIPAAAQMVHASGMTDQMVHPYYRLDPASVPVMGADDLLTRSAPIASITNRDLFITRTNKNLDSAVAYFGHGLVPGAIADISSAAALAKFGTVDVGGQPLLLLFVAMVMFMPRLPSKPSRALATATFVIVLAFGPGVLMDLGYITDVGSVMIAIAVYAPMQTWANWRREVELTSASSGLPNIEALAALGIPAGIDVIALRVSQYEQMLASLPRELHGDCARQIARRIAVTANDSIIYDNGNGHFVWQVQPFTTEALVGQLEGLRALFSAPLMIAGHILDTNVHFGLDRNGSSKPLSRIKSAIVCASEAEARLKLYEEFGSQRLAETTWELSLHARIDNALHNGDIWLAFQPQYDLRTGTINAAETLIRWTDPERGAIPPDSFILQAERAGRIDAITYWVLDHAITALETLESRVRPIQLSVNLSAWMVDQPSLISDIAAIVRRHQFDCSKLTFEVTETFSMANRQMAKQNLASLRAMGFGLSIDDFGTGQASLSYLSEIPSDEIKLDRRFIKSIT